MPIEFWIARDRFWEGEKYTEEKASHALSIFLDKEDVIKWQQGGKVAFYGYWLKLFDERVDQVLSGLGINLAPGEGPVSIEVKAKKLGG